MLTDAYTHDSFVADDVLVCLIKCDNIIHCVLCMHEIHSTNQSHQVRIKILQVKLDVKFTCTMSIELKGQVLARSNRYHNGAFIVNSEIQISTQGKDTTPFWQANVMLKTTRGANYNSGILRIRFSEIVTLEPNASVFFPLAKCYDPQAKAEAVLTRITRMNSESPKISMLDMDMKNRSESSLMKNLLKQEQHTYFGTADAKNEINGVAEIEARHLKQKVVDLVKQLSESTNKSNRIMEEVMAYRLARDQDEQKILKYQQQCKEKTKTLIKLESELKNMQNQLDEAHKYIEMKEQEDEEREQLHWEQMNKLKQRYEQQQLNNKQKLSKAISDIDEYKLKLAQKEGRQKDMLNIIKQMEQKINALEDQINTKRDQNTELQLKLKEVQHFRSTLVQQKQQALQSIKLKQSKRELQQLRTLRKTNRVLEDELTILKKNIDKTVRHKDSMLDKISLESKNKIQNFVLQLSKMGERLNDLMSKHEKTVKERDLYYEKNIDLESKLKQTNALSIQIKQKIKIGQREQISQKQKINDLEQQKIDLIQHKKRLEIQIQQLISKNILLEQKLQAQQKRCQYFQQQLQSAGYKIEKHSVQTALSVVEVESGHSSCVNKQNQLREQLNKYEHQSQIMSNQLAQLKNRNKENQRIVHELRLEENKHRDQMSKNIKRMADLDKKIQKLEKDVKDKNVSIQSSNEQRQTLVQLIKDNENKIYNLTVQSLSSHEKNMKLMTAMEQLQTRHNELQQEVTGKMQQIQKLQNSDLEMRKTINAQKQKVAKFQNDIRILRREHERYIHKVRSQISMVLPLSQSPSCNPVQSLITHHRSTMQRLQNSVSSIMRQLEAIKCQIEARNKTIEQLEIQISIKDAEIRNLTGLNRQLEVALEQKQSILSEINQEHNELLSIHEEYIFTFNRYKIDKDQQINGVAQQLAVWKQKWTDTNKTAQIRMSELSNKVNEMNVLKEQIFVLQGQLQSVQKQYASCSHVLNQSLTKLGSETKKCLKLSEDYANCLDSISKLTLQKQILQADLKQSRNQITHLKNINDLLSKNKQKFAMQTKLRQETLNNMDNEMLKLKSDKDGFYDDLEATRNQLKVLKDSIKEAKLKIKELQDDLNTSRSQVVKNQEQNTQKSGIIKQLQNMIRELTKSHKTTIQTLQFESKTTKSSSQLQAQQINLLGIRIAELENEVQIKQKCIRDVTETYDIQKYEWNGKHIYYLRQLDAEKEQTQKWMDLMAQTQAELQDQKKKHQQTLKQFADKEQQLYSAIGKLNEIEIKWENEQKRLRMKELSDHQRYEQQMDQTVHKYEQKIQSLELELSSALQKLSSSESIVASHFKKIYSLKQEIEEKEEYEEERAKIYENELKKVHVESQSKIQRLQQDLSEAIRTIEGHKKAKNDQTELIQKLRQEVRNEKEKNEQVARQLKEGEQKCGNLQELNTVLHDKIEKEKHRHVQSIQDAEKDIRKEFEIYVRSMLNEKQQAGVSSKPGQLLERVVQILLAQKPT